MSFQQGLSGLNAASKQLEVIGNNVANANTVGFKQARAEFADVYANSLSGGGGAQIGIGTKLSNVAQQFTQGNVTSTSNSLDLAINGGGFFRMSTGGVITYSRNGQFQMDKLGYIVDASGKRLTGYIADTAGAIQKGSPVDLNINTADLQPATTSAVVGLVNLDSRKTALDPAKFDPTDPTTYSDSTAITLYDSLGNAHTMQTFFLRHPTAAEAAAQQATVTAMPSSTPAEVAAKAAAQVIATAMTAAASPGANTRWSVYTSVDGKPTTYTPPATPITTAELDFNGTGISPTVTPTTIDPKTGLPLVTFSPITGATTPLSLTLDYSKSTQFGSSFSINSLSQNGYTSGRLAGFNTGADGTIIGRYSNGQSKNLGQVVLANFVNPNGLQSLGGNAWAESATSGAPLVGVPSTGSLGVLQASAVEDSNTDLTAELVNMITAQRFYQANAQTIKTQDQVLQTLVNLR
ncbi:flagellar hook protein FlgE [mine drainage metagenome]|uniref:Flagellar hook protein FlgE n=1 Tax=mine drainage metagenome TaxID=410659 RepID=A0A1J5RMG6_9ZZZZ